MRHAHPEPLSFQSRLHCKPIDMEKPPSHGLPFYCPRDGGNSSRHAHPKVYRYNKVQRSIAAVTFHAAAYDSAPDSSACTESLNEVVPPSSNSALILYVYVTPSSAEVWDREVPFAV